MNETESRTEVKVIKTELHCISCGGIMRPNGIMYPTAPPQYGHSCTVCKEEGGYRIWDKYPIISYEEVDKEKELLSILATAIVKNSGMITDVIRGSI